MISVEELKAAYPDIFAAIDKAGETRGFAAGFDKGRAEGIATGAEAERLRIQAVEAQCLPGHEKLVAAMKFDGATTGPEAAVRILGAEKAVRETKLQAFEADKGVVVATIDPTKPEAVAAAAAVQGEDETLPIDDRAKATWDKSPAVRAEFSGDFAAYLGYRKADAAGQVKIYKGKGG